MEECERNRAAEFNEELCRRLASLDRGEHVDPEQARAGLERKSLERRQSSRE